MHENLHSGPAGTRTMESLQRVSCRHQRQTALEAYRARPESHPGHRRHSGGIHIDLRPAGPKGLAHLRPAKLAGSHQPPAARTADQNFSTPFITAQWPGKEQKYVYSVPAASLDTSNVTESDSPPPSSLVWATMRASPSLR